MLDTVAGLRRNSGQVIAQAVQGRGASGEGRG